jgi:Cellulose binding domain/Bacterial Ig domain/Calx-beta domain/Glycosyl hydrolases family 18
MSFHSALHRWLAARQKKQRLAHRAPGILRHNWQARLETLEDRRLLTAAVATTYSVTNDWGSGFQAQIDLANQQASAVQNWQLSFDMARNITSIWNATIVSHTGNHYVIAGASWDSSIAGNSSLDFGFVAAGSGAGSSPANIVLNGVPAGSQPVTLPGLAIADVSATEPASGKANENFVVTLSAASSSPVTVGYSTTNGTAVSGTDYQSTTGTLTFTPGQTSQTISVPVLGGVVGSSSKTFSVNLSNPSGATLTRAAATGTIVDDISPPPPPPASGNFQYQVSSDWGSGFSAQITATNSSQQTISNWQMSFTFAANITSIWDATIVSHTGNQYVVKNAGWNASIAPGATISFGFNASPGGTGTVPSGYTLGNVPTGSTGGGTGSQAPTPAGDSVLVNPNQATIVNVLANDTDPAGFALSVTAITQPKDGNAVLNKDGTVTYTPKTGYTGSDSFSYTVSDGHGGTASALVSLTVGTPAATATWPTQFFAPYVDVTLYPTYNLVSTTQAQGITYYTLAFVTADSNNQPAWGGYTQYEINGGAFDMALRQQVASVRSLGGDVMASFGGAAGQELAQTITSVTQLTAAYQTVVTDYNLTHLDFDIEGAAEADHASIDRRSQALAALEQTASAAGHPLQIWYTLPVLPTGLTADGLYVLQSAQKYGVQLAGVNVMTMDYGESAAPNPQGNMGTFAIEAADSVFSQLQTLYGTAKTSTQLWQMIGITPMIGVNDDTNEVFDEAAARQLTAFAQQQGMGRISMWSLNRDTQGTAKNSVDDESSSITQGAFDFSKIFEGI